MCAPIKAKGPEASGTLYITKTTNITDMWPWPQRGSHSLADSSTFTMTVDSIEFVAHALLRCHVSQLQRPWTIGESLRFISVLPATVICCCAVLAHMFVKWFIVLCQRIPLPTPRNNNYNNDLLPTLRGCYSRSQLTPDDYPWVPAKQTSPGHHNSPHSMILIQSSQKLLHGQSPLSGFKHINRNKTQLSFPLLSHFTTLISSKEMAKETKNKHNVFFNSFLPPWLIQRARFVSASLHMWPAEI